MNKLLICDKCEAVNVDSILAKIKALSVVFEIEIGCHNMCAVGQKKPFVILNGQVIIGDNETELINKIKETI